MSGQSDRRPWLILSRREGQELLLALAMLSAVQELTPDMKTVREQIQKQIAWINGHDVEAPSREAAIEPEYAP